MLKFPLQGEEVDLSNQKPWNEDAKQETLIELWLELMSRGIDCDNFEESVLAFEQEHPGLVRTISRTCTSHVNREFKQLPHRSSTEEAAYQLQRHEYLGALMRRHRDGDAVEANEWLFVDEEPRSEFYDMDEDLFDGANFYPAYYSSPAMDHLFELYERVDEDGRRALQLVYEAMRYMDNEGKVPNSLLSKLKRLRPIVEEKYGMKLNLRLLKPKENFRNYQGSPRHNKTKQRDWTRRGLALTG